MHALLHRALTPQAITSAWLVVSVARALYAGAGPHGPRAPRAMPPIPAPAPYPGADLHLDSSLSLPRNALVATTPEGLPALMPGTGPTA
jgi:hypothetical protein